MNATTSIEWILLLLWNKFHSSHTMGNRMYAQCSMEICVFAFVILATYMWVIIYFIIKNWEKETRKESNMEIETTNNVAK